MQHAALLVRRLNTKRLDYNDLENLRFLQKVLNYTEFEKNDKTSFFSRISIRPFNSLFIRRFSSAFRSKHLWLNLDIGTNSNRRCSYLLWWTKHFPESKIKYCDGILILSFCEKYGQNMQWNNICHWFRLENGLHHERAIPIPINWLENY